MSVAAPPRRFGAAAVALAALVLAACGSPEPAAPPIVQAPGVPPLLIGRGAQLLRSEDAKERVLLRLPEGASIVAVEPSRDEARLALAVQAPPGRLATGEVDFGSDLYVADADGRDLRRVLAHAPAEFLDTPGWLPDGRLAFVARGARDGRPDHRLEALDLATGARERLVPSATAAALTPDGRHAVVLRLDRTAATEALVLADLERGRESPLVAGSAGFTLVTSLQVSPDGAWLAFAAAGGAESAARPAALIALAARHPTLHDIWVVSLDGGSLVRVAEIAELRPSITWSEDSSVLFTLGPDALRRVDVPRRRFAVVGTGVAGGVVHRAP